MKKEVGSKGLTPGTTRNPCLIIKHAQQNLEHQSLANNGTMETREAITILSNYDLSTEYLAAHGINRGLGSDSRYQNIYDEQTSMKCIINKLINCPLFVYLIPLWLIHMLKKIQERQTTT